MNFLNDQPIQGVLCVDKPPGITSAAVVGRVKRLLPRGTRIGHAGTLDPFATGVLLLLVGRATKQCEMLMGAPKEYIATLKLGATTESDDPETPEQVHPSAGPVTREALLAALATQVGEISQLPPIYSALKVGGRRACDRVRAGQVVQLAPRLVHIHTIELLSYAWPLARVRIACGRGTYIRAIARDVGQMLGVGAYLTELQRTRVGEHAIENAVTLEGLTFEHLVQRLRPAGAPE